jgi:putative endonuclease
LIEEIKHELKNQLLILKEGRARYIARGYAARSPKSSTYFMYYIYLIQNKGNKSFYYGYSADLRRRLREHNESGDWELIYYEAYRSEEDARKRERKLKDYGQSRTHLKRRLFNSLLK